MRLKDNSEDRKDYNISFADNDNYSDTLSRQAGKSGKCATNVCHAPPNFQ